MLSRQGPRRLLQVLSRTQLSRRFLSSSRVMTSLANGKDEMALQQPRQFPTTGFEVIDPAQKLEEERLPFYICDEYYPMQIGEVIHVHYQVVAKLGYGVTSTVWLARDLRDAKYWALKVYINTMQHNQELLVYKHLANAPTNTPTELGFQNVRQSHESFQIDGPAGKHDVLVMKPLGMSLRSFQDMQQTGFFPRETVAGAMGQVFLGMNLLLEADVIHTDLHADNLLIALTDESILSRVEQNEIDTPIARKQLGERFIYGSQYVLGGAGPLVISDFGQARIGAEQHGNAMPVPYRAPEVILGMQWGPEVDRWSAGLLAWDLLEKEKLFDVYDSESQEHNDACHLAAMTALMGPPPRVFLERSPATRKYWDDDGDWTGLVPLPTERTFESLATSLKGDERDTFLNFVQCFVWWVPERRLTALQGYMHPFVQGKTMPKAVE
ncbi:Serine/threonine-protein kinase SRPK [Beauveria bassiana]|nr:Serine/threonine-protein kinase SRPK [Beauveria bassiana]